MNILRCSEATEISTPCTEDGDKFEVEYQGRTVPAILSPKLSDIVLRLGLTRFTNVQGLVISNTTSGFSNPYNDGGEINIIIILDEERNGAIESIVTDNNNYYYELDDHISIEHTRKLFNINEPNFENWNDANIALGDKNVDFFF